jgi:hypothetical protein
MSSNASADAARAKAASAERAIKPQMKTRKRMSVNKCGTWRGPVVWSGLGNGRVPAGVEHGQFKPKAGSNAKVLAPLSTLFNFKL